MFGLAAAEQIVEAVEMCSEEVSIVEVESEKSRTGIVAWFQAGPWNYHIHRRAAEKRGSGAYSSCLGH